MNWSLARRRTNLQQRARIIQAIRQFFTQAGFLEVETPLRIPAPAPEAHIDAIPSGDWFMQTSPELCMKRLLSADYGNIYQISHCWRAGERGARHLTEFTMLEWYRVDADYRALMEDCTGLIRAAAAAAGCRGEVRFRGESVSLEGPWEMLSVGDAFRTFGGMEMGEALERDLFDQVMVERIEPRLGSATPTFLYDYPAARGALARLKPDNPALAERFELYLNGVELANGFSELTDAAEQRRRFEEEERYRRSSGRTPYPEATRFLDELPLMPPSAGIALGIDRLVMTLLDATAIDEVVAFTPEEL